MDKLTLIKVGGKIVEEQETLSRLLVAFAAIPEKKVLVHGGGRSATAMASRLGIESRMVGGRRITDKSMLEVVTMVYGGLVNKSIVAGLQAVGVNALGMTGADMNILLSDKRLAGEVDYGYVGDVRHADGKALTGLIEMGVVPVIAPLTHDGKGFMLNTNADTMAGETAKAWHLITMSHWSIASRKKECCEMRRTTRVLSRKSIFLYFKNIRRKELYKAA